MNDTDTLRIWQRHPALLGTGAMLGDGRKLYERQQAALNEATAAARKVEGYAGWHSTRAAVEAYLRSMREAEAGDLDPHTQAVVDWFNDPNAR